MEGVDIIYTREGHYNYWMVPSIIIRLSSLSSFFPIWFLLAGFLTENKFYCHITILLTHHRSN